MKLSKTLLSAKQIILISWSQHWTRCHNGVIHKESKSVSSQTSYFSGSWCVAMQRKYWQNFSVHVTPTTDSIYSLVRSLKKQEVCAINVQRDVNTAYWWFITVSTQNSVSKPLSRYGITCHHTSVHEFRGLPRCSECHMIPRWRSFWHEWLH
jgi:hypothetical protein